MPAVSYVDRRDTLNRLGRINVTGDPAVGWLTTLDPNNVREISDQDLARLVGVSYIPPIPDADLLTPATDLLPSPDLLPGTGLIAQTYPSATTFPSSSLFPGR